MMNALRQNLYHSLTGAGPVKGVAVCYQSNRELAQAIARFLPFTAYVADIMTTKVTEQVWCEQVSHVIEVYEPDTPGYEICKTARMTMRRQGWQILSLFDWKKDYLVDEFWRGINYQELSQQLAKIKKQLEGIDSFHITSALGTDISFAVTGRKWIAADGICSDEHLAQLPDGEIYTCPIEETFSGVLVVDGTITRSWLPTLPQRLVFEQGRLMECPPEFQKYIAPFGEDITMIGEFALGFNPGCRQIRHNISVDEKSAGTVHFALGDSYNLGQNQCNCHIDMVIREPKVVTVPVIKLPGF